MDDDAVARLDARLQRVEAALERVASTLEGANPRGPASAGAGLEQRLAAVEASVSRVSQFAQQVEDTLAMGVDVADDWVQEAVGGDEADLRMRAGLQALLTVTRPETLAALSGIAEKAPQLTRLVELGASFDDTVAMGTDMVDAWIADEVGGDSLSERLDASKHAALVITQPQTLAALTRLAALAPQLESVASLGASFDDTVAMATDVIDDVIRTRFGGDGLNERIAAVLHALEQVSDPDVLQSVAEITTLAPKLKKTAHLAAELDDLVDVMGDALRVHAEPIGPMGMLWAMRDPDVQRGLGQAIEIARHLGRNHTNLPVKH